jgi:hypothetical protein
LSEPAAGRCGFLGDGFRSGGGPGILAASPDHVVFAAYGVAGLITGQVHARPVSNTSRISERVVARVGANVLDRKLGIHIGAPDGLAVGSDGTIYTDANSSVWSTASALVEIEPTGHIRRLWTSH